MKKTKTQKGITLIALIITIVVLLILAVVAIRAVQGDGILSYAKNARDDYQTAKDDEETQLQNYLNILNENNPNGSGSSEGKDDNTEEPTALTPGLYAEDGTMTYSWDVLTDKEKLSFEYSGSTYPALVVTNGVLTTTKAALSDGYAVSASALNGYLVLDDSVEKIEYAFYGCKGLTAIYIPNTVMELSSSFVSCSNLSTINYGGTIDEWNEMERNEDTPAWNMGCPEITVNCTTGKITI